MHASLRTFVERQCVHHPAALYPVKTFVLNFRASLPAKSRDAWSRGRIVAALSQAGFAIGERAKVQLIAGLAPRGEWREVGGRLEMVSE